MAAKVTFSSTYGRGGGGGGREEKARERERERRGRDRRWVDGVGWGVERESEKGGGDTETGCREMNGRGEQRRESGPREGGKTERCAGGGGGGGRRRGKEGGTATTSSGPPYQLFIGGCFSFALSVRLGLTPRGSLWY